jgi:hypothetical protein
MATANRWRQVNRLRPRVFGAQVLKYIVILDHQPFTVERRFGPGCGYPAIADSDVSVR